MSASRAKSSELSPQQAKSERVRTAIIKSTIASLAKSGYSETSLLSVATRAGYSKGAVQYHFSSKEELMDQVLNELLSRSFPPKTVLSQTETVESALRGSWKKFVNTSAYRALLEILNASLTDKGLAKRIRSDLKDWGTRMDEQSLEIYEAVSGDDREVIKLLNMHRSFMRGLLFQKIYGQSDATTLEYLEEWVAMIAPRLRFRSQD